MILLADLRNRFLAFSLYNGNREQVASFKTMVDKLKSADEYALSLRQFLLLNSLKPEEIEGALLESVVPTFTKRVEKAISTVLGKKILLFSHALKTGLRIRMDHPEEVGSNLLSAALGAIDDYQKDSLVICLGSCLSFSVVSKEKEYLGGSLFPGIRESLAQMITANAQLSEIELTRPGRLIGKSTSESMNSGLVRGYMLLLDRMSEEIEKEYGKPLLRVLTGPDAPILKDYLGHSYIYNPHLLFDGLFDIYQKNIGRK